MSNFDDDGQDWSHLHDTEIYGLLAVLKVVQIASYDPTLNPAARRMLGILAGHTNREGYAWPSHGSIARKMGVSRQAVMRQIQVLVKGRYISSEKRYNKNGGYSSNKYRFNFALVERYLRVPEAYRAFIVTKPRSMVANPISDHLLTSGDYSGGNVHTLHKQNHRT